MKLIRGEDIPNLTKNDLSDSHFTEWFLLHNNIDGKKILIRI